MITPPKRLLCGGFFFRNGIMGMGQGTPLKTIGMERRLFMFSPRDLFIFYI
jgi:hypothetical protein